MKGALKALISSRLRDQKGVTFVLVALLMFFFLGLTALVVDLSHLYVVRNELQNAADAGALAGARFLYNDYGTGICGAVGIPDCPHYANQFAYDTARANTALSISGAIAADVNWSSGQNMGGGVDGLEGVDVQRGHWSFGLTANLARGFYPNDSLLPVDLWGVSTEDLDANRNFINAVRVVARRQRSGAPTATPASSFFAQIFGFQNFELEAEAVAYIGFSGTLAPGDVDAPIAICRQSLTTDSSGGCESADPYNCNIGYMLSDGQDKNTAGWTNFSQPCDTADTGDLRNLLTCADSNPNEISLGAPIGATNGVVDAVINHPTHNSLVDCWKHAYYDSDGDGEKDTAIPLDPTNGLPTRLWNLTLPVVNCPEFRVSNCMETCGAVNVNIAWILEKENDINTDAPYNMMDWHSESTDGITRWDSFVTHFNLKTPNGDLATYANGGFKKKSIYFLPDCTPHELKGNTGGHNYGVLARIPVLVR